MATRKKNQNEKDPDSPSLSEILQEDSDHIGLSYNGVDSVALHRITYCVTSLGGMVTYWFDNNNARLCFSMRLWGEHRSYNCDTPEQFAQITEPLVAKLTKVMQSKKLPPPTPFPIDAPVKQK